MLSTIIKLSLVGLSCLSTVSAGPIVKFPLSNGFPNVTNPSAALTAIEVAAHGSLSNAPGAMGISADTITSLQLIAFNELSEVAFFTQLLTNITTSAPGFEIEDAASKAFIIKTLTAVQAQEELHELNANGALMKNHATTIQPCEYNFPVNTFAEAVALASTFTDVVLGTLQQVQTLFANSMLSLPSIYTSTNNTRRRRRSNPRCRLCNRPRRRTKRLLPHSPQQNPLRPPLPHNQHTRIRFLGSKPNVCRSRLMSKPQRHQSPHLQASHCLNNEYPTSRTEDKV